ncbi:MAG: DUF5671 domain-containing protein [Patescibacteria group bacterium]|mgnify:CR=1 FL=1
MDRPRTTPKDFFLWVGAMISLYAGVVAFIALIFDYINYAFPDPLAYFYDPYTSAAYEMAALIVLAPVFLVLMRLIRRDIARDPSRGEIFVRRWALFLTVFVAGATIVIDLITLIYTFLSGEDLSVRFLLKVLVVLLVAGAGFLHFLADIRGYWTREPKYAASINWGVAALIVASIAAGFFIIGTPGDARGYRMDEQKVSDLQSIQWQLVNFWQQKETLPADLAELNDPISGFRVPADPQTGGAYVYGRTSTSSFKLCATFNAKNRFVDTRYTEPVMAIPAGVKNGGDTWEHGPGETCFARTIDPERYPPYSKTR